MEKVNEEDELMKSIIAKIGDNEKANLANEKTISQIKEDIKKLPDRDMMAKILHDLEKIEKGQVEVNGDFRQLAYTFLINYKQDGRQAEAAEKLTEAMNGHRQVVMDLFEKPLEKSIRYTHFLGKPLLVLGAAFFIISVMVFFLVRANIKAGEHERNDIQWRYMMLTRDLKVLDSLLNATAAYRDDPVLFRQGVEEEEERRAELYAKQLQREQTEQEIEKLNEKEKPLPRKE